MRMAPRDEFGHFVAAPKLEIGHSPSLRYAEREAAFGGRVRLPAQPRANPLTEPLASAPQAHLSNAQAIGGEPIASSPEQIRTRIRNLIGTGMTATQVAQKINKPLDSVRDEADKMWKELATDVITTPLNVRVQAIMKAMSVYSQSCQALDIGELRSAERIKYMGLALDSSKEIVKYPAEIARDEKDGGRDERTTKEDLDLAISLLNQHIVHLQKEEAEEKAAKLKDTETEGLP